MAITANLLSADDAGFETTIGTWAAGANTSVARTTAQFLNGAASMRLTSSAAGSMIASTGKYAVSANTEYEAFVFAANASAASGRVVSVRIDWYTSADVFISSSTTTTTETLPNSTAWCPVIIVVGTSPGTAAKAALTVQVTAGITAAGQQVAIDTCGLGLPIQDTGNLIPYNVASMEMDVSGWTVSNGTTSRSTGSAEGAYCLKAMSTAAGDMPLTTAARVAVTAGTKYEVYPWIYAPAAGRSVILDLRWYTASVGGTLLSTSTRTITTVQTTIFERHTLLGTAPVGATHVEIRVRPQASGAGELWYIDRVTLRPQPLLAGNTLPYSAQSIEVDASDWTAASNCTIARSVPGEQAFSGAYSLKVTCTAIGQAKVSLASTVPVTAGQYYVARSWFLTVGPTPSTVWVDIDWYDASMAYLGNAQPDQDSPLTGGSWKVDQIGRRAPAGAAFAKVHVLPQATSAGQVFYLDEISLAPGTPPYDLMPHPETASVTITMNNLAGISTLDLYRVDPDGTRSPVRGFGSDVVGYTVTGSTMVFEDYEVPLGQTLRYEYVRSPGGTTRTASTSVAPPADANYIWVTDPGEPARNILAMVEKPPAWKRSVERGTYRVRNAKRTIVVSDVRADREGELALLTWSEAEHDEIEFLLDTGSTVLLRARPGWGLDKVYVSVGDTSEEPLSPVGSQWARRWTLPLTVVDRPVGGMAGSAGRTWQTVKDAPTATTWAAVRDNNATWLTVLQGV